MKIKFLFAVIASVCILSSCGGDSSKSLPKSDNESAVQDTATGWNAQYDLIAAKDLPDNVIQLIGDEWMLVTSGVQNDYNTMTASWGGMGYIWNRPASFIFIRDTRYTYQFLEREEGFTLSFFTEDYRGALKICGTKSGRDTDKVKEAGLTPIVTPSGLVSFAEARMIVECKKMFEQELNTDHLIPPYKDEIIKESYAGEPSMHQMFISEITNVWIKK